MKANNVNYHRDWECDGAIVMEDPKTIHLYHEYRKAEEEFITSIMEKRSDPDRERKYDEARVKMESYLDPQELYFYQYNNYECMYSDDHDAYNAVVDYLGEEKAKLIKRI